MDFSRNFLRFALSIRAHTDACPRLSGVSAPWPSEHSASWSPQSGAAASQDSKRPIFSCPQRGKVPRLSESPPGEFIAINCVWLRRMEGATFRPGYVGWFSAVRRILCDPVRLESPSSLGFLQCGHTPHTVITQRTARACWREKFPPVRCQL